MSLERKFICVLCFVITILIWNIKKTPDSVEVLKDNLGENEIIDFDEDLPLAPIQNIDPPLED